MENLPYREIIGSLMYDMMICTKPDIAFAICFLSQYSNNLGKIHWIALKMIIRYIKGTLNFCIRYNHNEEDIMDYSDVDWAGDLDKRKSTSRFVFIYAEGPIYWASRKQDCVALSNTEAEYVALSQCTREAIWLQRMKSYLLEEPQKKMIIKGDNQGSLALENNPIFHKRTKHIDIQHHFIRSDIEEEKNEIIYCPT